MKKNFTNLLLIIVFTFTLISIIQHKPLLNFLIWDMGGL